MAKSNANLAPAESQVKPKEVEKTKDSEGSPQNAVL